MRKNKRILLAILMASAMPFNCTAAVFADSEDDFVEYVTPYVYALSYGLSGYCDFDNPGFDDPATLWFVIISYWQWMYENEGAEYLTRQQISVAQEVFAPGSGFVSPPDYMLENGEVSIEKRDNTEIYKFPNKSEYIIEYNPSEFEDFEISLSGEYKVESSYILLMTEDIPYNYRYDFVFEFKPNKRASSRLSAALRPKYILSSFELPSYGIDYDIKEIEYANIVYNLLSKHDSIYYRFENDDGSIRDKFYLNYNGEKAFISYKGYADRDYYESFAGYYKGFAFYENDEGRIIAASYLTDDPYDGEFGFFDYSLVKDRCSKEVRYTGESEKEYRFTCDADYYEDGSGEYHSDTYVIDRETFEVVEKTYFTSYFTEAEYEIEAEEGIFDYNSGTVYAYYDEIDTEEHKDLFSPLADWKNKLRTVTVIFGEYRDDGKLEYTRFTFKIPGTWEYLPHEAYHGKYAVFMDKAATKKYVYPGSNKSYTIYVLPFEAN